MTKKTGGQLCPLPRSFFPKSSDQRFKSAILFCVVKKSNNYVFEDDLIPQSPRGKGCKLWTFPIVYIQYCLLGSTLTFLGGIFAGSGEGVAWEDLYMEEFIMGEENSHEGAPDSEALF